jgi:hypothetical protein
MQRLVLLVAIAHDARGAATLILMFNLIFDNKVLQKSQGFLCFKP